MMSLSFGLVLLAGVLTVMSPYILPILPIVLGRSLQSHRYGPVALMLGLIGGFALAGSLLGVTASWLTQFASALRSGAIVLLLAIGLLALFSQWRYRLLSYLPVSQPSDRLGLAGEFWLGTQLGLLRTPCAGPVLGSILVLAAVSHQAESAFVLLLLSGIGAALPMLAFAYGGRYLRAANCLACVRIQNDCSGLGARSWSARRSRSCLAGTYKFSFGSLRYFPLHPCKP